MIGAFHLALSSLPVVLPFLAQHRLGVDDKWFGFPVGSYTIGIMTGFVAAGLLSLVLRNRQQTIAASAATVGVLFCLTGLSTTFWAAWSALFGVGTGIGIVIVNLMRELQLSTTEAERGAHKGSGPSCLSAVVGCPGKGGRRDPAQGFNR